MLGFHSVSGNIGDKRIKTEQLTDSFFPFLKVTRFGGFKDEKQNVVHFSTAKCVKIRKIQMKGKVLLGAVHVLVKGSRMKQALCRRKIMSPISVRIEAIKFAVEKHRLSAA